MGKDCPRRLLRVGAGARPADVLAMGNSVNPPDTVLPLRTGSCDASSSFDALMRRIYAKLLI